MLNRTPLFESEHLRLAPIDIEKDAPVEAPWTVNLDYTDILTDHVRPLTIQGLKKIYQEIRKQANDKQNLFHYMIREKKDDRLLGCLRLCELNWAHQNGVMMLRFGNQEDFGSYAPEALRMGMRYAFEELNLYNLRVSLLPYDTAGIQLHEAAGFSMEVRRRERSYRHGQYWDELLYVLLRPEWDEQLKKGI